MIAKLSGKKRTAQQRENMARAKAGRLPLPLKGEEWAYLAGILDGEGTIGIYRRTQPGRWPILEVKVSNTDRPLLEWVTGKIGGTTYEGKLRNLKSNHRPVHTWRCGGLLASEVLTHCLPFLIVKKERAMLAINFIKHRFDKDEMGEECRLRLSVLNRRGRR